MWDGDQKPKQGTSKIKTYYFPWREITISLLEKVLDNDVPFKVQIWKSKIIFTFYKYKFVNLLSHFITSFEFKIIVQKWQKMKFFRDPRRSAPNQVSEDTLANFDKKCFHFIYLYSLWYHFYTTPK